MPYNYALPNYDDLNDQQKNALNEPDPISLTGGPGTGKSVISLMRHINNHASGDEDTLLLTYTKTLEFYFKGLASFSDTDADQHIDRTQYFYYNLNKYKNYDEIIVDEAQDIKHEFYRQIYTKCNSISYGADKGQSVYLTEKEKNDLFDWFESNLLNNVEYELLRNYRSSREILQFIRSVFPNYSIPHDAVAQAPESGNLPIVHCTGWSSDKESKEKSYIKDILEVFYNTTTNIAVLVPYQSQVTHYYDLISKLGNYNISKYNADMDNFQGIENLHITTFKSSKGLEFDTVIIPRFDSMNYFINEAKYKVSEEEYFVALSRAKRNLYLLCYNNPNLGHTHTFQLD